MDERIMQNTVALGIIKAAARFPFIAQRADTDCYTVLADAAIAELRADGYAIVPVSSARADREAVVSAADDRCWCGHERRDHENGTISCLECDCECFFPATPEPERAE